MKTLQEIKEKYNVETLNSGDLVRLLQFVPENELKDFGLELRSEYVGKHEHKKFSRKNILRQLKKDVEFGFEKALGKRSISASCMNDVIRMWNWILEEGLENYSEYPQYGLPVLKATAVKYGFYNPIGEDSGSEEKYEEE